VQYNVAQLLKAPIGTTQTKTIYQQVPSLDDEWEIIGPVEGEVRLMRTDAGVLVRGKVQANVLVECSRCLVPTIVTLNAELQEEFSPSDDFASLRRSSDEPCDPALVIDEQHILDLSDLIRQQLVLDMPSHPLCRVDCAGLCPECGQDLNESPCECTPGIDARWQVLKDLRLEKTSGIEDQ